MLEEINQQLEFHGQLELLNEMVRDDTHSQLQLRLAHADLLEISADDPRPNGLRTTSRESGV